MCTGTVSTKTIKLNINIFTIKYRSILVIFWLWMAKFVLQMQNCIIVFLCCCVASFQSTWTARCVRVCSQPVLNGQPTASLYVFCRSFLSQPSRMQLIAVAPAGIQHLTLECYVSPKMQHIIAVWSPTTMFYCWSICRFASVRPLNCDFSSVYLVQQCI